MRRITALCDALGKPWTDLVPSTRAEEGWHQSYKDIR